MIRHLVVLCTGNICRSPMGEALLARGLRERGVVVGSAGTGALPGLGADPEACATLLDHGIDISQHRARQATLEMLSAADLILTLDQTHNRWVEARFPQLRGRAHKIRKWLDNADVADPYQLPRAAFERAYQDIAAGVEGWLGRL